MTETKNMSKALQVIEGNKSVVEGSPSQLVAGLSPQDKATIMSLCMPKGANDSELALYLYRCKEQGFDPLSGELVLQKRISQKDGSVTLSFINPSKNLFNCWSCHEGGGVLEFIALLDNTSIEEVKRSLWGENRSPRKPLHPAEKLTPNQLKMLGFVGCGWGKLKQKDPDYFKRTLDFVWQEWLNYVIRLKHLAYIGLLTLNNSLEIRSNCKKYAVQLSVSTEELLFELTTIKFSRNKPEWAISAELFVKEAKRSEKQPDLEMAGR